MYTHMYMSVYLYLRYMINSICYMMGIMHTCIYACLHVCIYECMCACMYIYVFTERDRYIAR